MKSEYIYKDYASIDKKGWDQYVYNHKEGSIFQTSSYLNLHNGEFKSIPFGYALFQNNTICGIVSGVIFYNYFNPISFFTRRAIIMGGPLVDNNDKELCERLLKELQKKLRRKAIYIEFRNLWDMSCFDAIFKSLGFTYEKHLDIHHDLTEAVDSIKSKVSKNKRGNINKSINKGTHFEEVREITKVKKGIELVLETYKRVGLPCFEKKYFIHAFELLNKKGILKVFTASINNQIIGTRMELCYKDVVYDWYAGADEEYKNYYPNDFIPFQILVWGKENGFKLFDFGGAGKPEVPYGVREHKLKFGGNLVEYGRYEYILYPIWMKLGKLGFFIFKKMKK